MHKNKNWISSGRAHYIYSLYFECKGTKTKTPFLLQKESLRPFFYRSYSQKDILRRTIVSVFS